MTSVKLSALPINLRKGKPININQGAPPTPYVRPSDWPALPTLTTSSKQFSGLFAIFNAADNDVAMTVAGSLGFTVSWGDSVTNVQSITAASGSGTAVTYTVTSTSQFSAGQQVVIAGITGGTGGTSYSGTYTIATVASATTFTVTNARTGTASLSTATATDNFNYTSGSTALHTFTYTGSLNHTSRGYDSAIITITPQSTGTLTSINLGVQTTSTGANFASSPWLDIVVASSALTILNLGTSNGGTATMRLSLLESCNIVSCGLTSMAYLLQNCSTLQNVAIGTTGTLTSTNNMFLGCYSLQSVPLFNTASVTTMSSMFQTCASLQTVPLFNTASVLTMASMFNGCNSLQSVPLFNTALVTTMASMFVNCYSLQTVPLFNTAAVTVMSNMFNACNSLQSVPLFNTASVTNMSFMFQTCSSLQTVPLFNTAAVTNMGTMFSTCSSLQTVPLFNTAAVTTVATMFSGCTSLQTLPALNLSGLTAATTSFLPGSFALRSAPVTGLVQTTTFASNRLSTTDIDAIFTSIGTIPSAKTISVVTPSTPAAGSVQYTTSAAHGFKVGQTVVIAGVTPAGYSGTFTIVAIQSTTQFSVTNATTGAASLSTPTATISATITTTGNYGSPGTTSIATGKGWTVVS